MVKVKEKSAHYVKSQPVSAVGTSVGAFEAKAPTCNQVEIGARVREARESLGLTQDGLALAVGGSKPGIRDNESGNNVPGGKMIFGLVRLGINANWLLTGEGPMRLSGLQERAGTPAPAALDVAALQTVTALLEEELAKKHARLDPARKAEVIALLYEEAVAESEEEPRRGRVLHLLRLVA